MRSLMPVPPPRRNRPARVVAGRTGSAEAPRVVRRIALVVAVVIVVAALLASGLAGVVPPAPGGRPVGTPAASSDGRATAVRATASATPAAGLSGTLGGPASATAAAPSNGGPPPGPTVRAPFTSIQMGGFRVAGPHPQSWGSSTVPPGAPFPAGAVPTLSANPSNPGSSENSSVFWSGHCAGLYPTTGNATYYDGCVGHDEPGIQFYSDAPGSAGNITWNVTLPVDAGPSRNQSNLYVAVWFGMTLSDRLAWLDQCFLELQLYPDSSWSVPAVSGEWIGAAVAWQIEAATGYEDPCYYSPLYLHGVASDGYFNMTGGDRLTVSMSGWANDPWGENITLVDRTRGTESNLTLFDPYANFPLDPAYSTNSYENGLQWTPGGEYPAVFAFETGHGRNPDYPANTTFNYCSPGRPPATAANPYVPCPSYDPGSWANDTVRPWRIDVPTFGSAAGSATAAQVAFTQDLGGITLDSGVPGCPGNLGSAYCSYPWYSYSCATHSFQFGATDYPGVSEDFGKYLQYAGTPVVDDLGFGYYPPTNFTIPTCGAPSATVNLSVSGSAGGQVYFLSHPYPSPGARGGLAEGAYALRAIGNASARFAGWSVTGDVAVAGRRAAWTTVWVNGSGGVTAEFQPTAPTTSLTFDDRGAAGAVAVLPSNLETDGGIPIATETDGGSLALPSGIYSAMAYAPPGYNFTSWSTNGSGAILAAPDLPDSWLVVTGAGGPVTVTAGYARSASADSITVGVSGHGTVNLSGRSGTSFSEVLPVGTYPVAAVADPGWAFQGWYAGGSAAMPDMEAVTNLSLENGSAYLYGYFVELPVAVLLRVAPASAGLVSILPSIFERNDSSAEVATGLTTVTVFVQNGFEFVGWTVNRSGAAWPESPRAAVSPFLLNRTVTLTAHFVSAPLVAIDFRIDPPSGGFIQFNEDFYGNGSGNGTSNGSYELAFLPSTGFAVNGSSTSGPLSVGTNVLLISGGGGVLTARFTQIPETPVAVTFVSEPVGTMTGRLNGTAFSTGETLWLSPGTYPLAVATVPSATFVAWTTAGALLVGGIGSNLTLEVAGGGTLYAIGAPFVVTNASVGPSNVDVGRPVRFSAGAVGAGPFGYLWSGAPTGCPAVPNGTTANFTCRPSAIGVYTITLAVTDPVGAQVEVGPFVLNVTPQPTILRFTASAPALTVGASTLLTVVLASPPGGVPPLSFLYLGLPTGCASRNTSQLACTPLSNGTPTVEVRVTDALGVRAEANLTLSIAPRPELDSFVMEPTAVTVGVATNLSVGWTGGTGPFQITYFGLPTGCISLSLARFTCRPTGPGNFSVSVVVSDVDGFTAGSSVLPLTVNPDPTIHAFRAVPSIVTVGDATQLTVLATGGTGSLTYTYANLPTGCTSADTDTLTCRPGAAGNFTLGVAVVDGFGVTASATVHLSVVEAQVPPPKGPSSAGLSATEWGLVGLAVAAVVGIGASLILRRRRVE